MMNRIHRIFRIGSSGFAWKPTDNAAEFFTASLSGMLRDDCYDKNKKNFGSGCHFCFVFIGGAASDNGSNPQQHFALHCIDYREVMLTLSFFTFIVCP